QDVDGARDPLLHAGAQRAVPADLRLQSEPRRRARQHAAAAEEVPVQVRGRVYFLVQLSAPDLHERIRVMKGFVIVAPLAFLLSAAPVFAQAAQQPPAQPVTQPPATPPVAPPAQPAQPPVPFPVGAKTAFINPQRILQESVEGTAAVTRI